jgi:heme exporter protein D
MQTMLSTYTGFIVTAYAAAIVIIAGLIAWIMCDHHRLRRVLAEAESRGVSRRSQRSGKEMA